MTRGGAKCPNGNLLNSALARQKKGKVKKGDRRYTDKQALYSRDDTVRCQGCKLLFANDRSYLDHALFCEQIEEHRKQAICDGRYSRLELKEMNENGKSIRI